MSYSGSTFSNYKKMSLCNPSILFTLDMSQLRIETIKIHLFIVYFLSFALSITSQTPSPRISTDPSYYYNLCAPSVCNNLSLSYPFSPPIPCHPSPLQPFCPTNESLLLTNPTSTDTFRVISINFTDPDSIPFFIASDSLFTCGAQVSRPNYWNYASMFTLPITSTYGTHFNCTRPITSVSIQGLQNASCIGCEGQDPFNICYYAPGIVPAPVNCEIYYIFTPAELSFNASAVRDLRTFLQSGFQVRYDKPEGCSECEASGGRCGASPTTASLVCFCSSSVHRTNCTDGMQEDISRWVNGTRTTGSRPSRAAVAAISASASVVLVSVIIALVLIIIYRRKKDIHFNKEAFSSISPTRYSYSQLKKFTNDFASKLGEGGFGTVYKGTIHQSGVEIPVAVKMMKKSKQTEKQFKNEIQTIGSVHHHNLVGMLGYCVERNTRAVVYEFMENGSLHHYIYNIRKEMDGVEDATKNDIKVLSSKQMYKIGVETARGIVYLHQGCRNKILHCDIKPPNVLLDSNFSAKVADFGLARIIDKDHSHVSLTAAQGTPGYAAPEMWLKTLGPVTDKSDVYSYGMLILEMVGRRKNYDPEAADSNQVYFPEWLYNKVQKYEYPLPMSNGDTDVSIGLSEDEMNRHEEDEAAVQRMGLVGLWCIQHIPSNRPSMERAMQMLAGHVEIGIPPYPFP